MQTEPKPPHGWLPCDNCDRPVPDLIPVDGANGYAYLVCGDCIHAYD
jgi:hypothetical protein